MTAMNKGILYAIGAYGIWGFLPIYWKALQSIPADQILAHRFVWSFLFLLAIIYWKKEWPRLKTAFTSPRMLAIYGLAASLLAVNWLVYIWAVNAGFIVETSLGYFINPLVNVLLGVIFLRERLRVMQWVPVALAAGGVLYLTFSYGAVPWIALVLASTFGLYGLLKKTAPLPALQGLSLETGILFMPAAVYLLFKETQGTGALGHGGAAETTLLLLAGVITAFPLLLFGASARRINLSTLGILQYMAPTIQFLLGVLVYGEPFTQARLIGFSVIWLALILYTTENILARRRTNLVATSSARSIE